MWPLSPHPAIALLKDKEPGAFLIRDSNSFQGAYGLALKVATPPPNCAPHSSKGKHLCGMAPPNTVQHPHSRRVAL